MIVAVAAVLAGCAPADDQAWGNCIRSVSSTYRLEHDISEDSDRYAESLEHAADECGAARDHDPRAFADLWD